MLTSPNNFELHRFQSILQQNSPYIHSMRGSKLPRSYTLCFPETRAQLSSKSTRIQSCHRVGLLLTATERRANCQNRPVNRERIKITHTASCAELTVKEQKELEKTSGASSRKILCRFHLVSTPGNRYLISFYLSKKPPPTKKKSLQQSSTAVCKEIS